MAPPLALQIASSALTVLGQVQSGKAAAAAGKAQAAQARARAAQREIAAKQARAQAQRQARTAQRRADLAQSNALARFAASGGAADPSTRSVLAQFEGDGQLSALAAMSEGESRAQAQEFGASMDRFNGAMAEFRGRQAQSAANLGALSGGLSFAAKYGEKLSQSSASPRTPYQIYDPYADPQSYLPSAMWT